LAIKRLRQIKKEIRVIGVAAKCDAGGITIIGVVFRGNLWLDGVLRTRSVGADNGAHSGDAQTLTTLRAGPGYTAHPSKPTGGGKDLKR